MRIGLNLLYLLPGIVGGTEKYATGLLQALDSISPSEEFWLFVNKETDSHHLFQSGNWRIVTCPVYAISRIIRYIWEQIGLPFQVKKHCPDLLHSLGYVQPLHLPCKSVVTIHDLHFRNIGNFMSPIRRALLRYFITQSAKRADHIITVSKYSKRQIVELLGVHPKKVTVTYNAVRPLRPVSFEKLGQQYGIHRPYIFALSSPSPHKNLGNLIKAFALLKQRGFEKFKLVLSGHKPNNSETLNRAIHELKLNNEIVFTGYVPENVLAGLYNHAKIFVFPSLYEGFGIPVLEAFLYETPVACSRVAALPEIAGNAAHYFDPKNIEEIAGVIGRILCNENLRTSLIEKGKKRVTQFTWEETARRTIEVYKKVIGNKYNAKEF